MTCLHDRVFQSQLKLREAEEQRQLTVAKTQRKVQLLKAQFVEHKNKWEAVSTYIASKSWCFKPSQPQSQQR